jgi:NADH-quinone oxidoreductase subunit C
VSDENAVAETAEAEEEAVERDERREALLADLSGALGDVLVAHHLVAGRDLWLRVATDHWVDAVRICREQGMTYFGFLSGLDWKVSSWGRYEDTAFDEAPADEEGGGGTIQLPEGSGYAGGDSRFQVFCRLHSIERGLGVTLKADLDEEYPEVPTISGLFPGADWHERETWEMFGFVFLGHPHLQHLYLPGDFEGNPMRKDFPLLAREVKPWPGVVDVEPIPAHLEEELERAVMAEAEAAEAGAGGDA